MRDGKLIVDGRENEAAEEQARNTAPWFLPHGRETWKIADEVVRCAPGGSVQLVRTYRELRGGTGLTAGWSADHDGRVVALKWPAPGAEPTIDILQPGSSHGTPPEDALRRRARSQGEPGGWCPLIAVSGGPAIRSLAAFRC
jgi:hypothetical protein